MSYRKILVCDICDKEIIGHEANHRMGYNHAHHECHEKKYGFKNDYEFISGQEF